jgi:RimJ/RimL family protein N-acetyltransferase
MAPRDAAISHQSIRLRRLEPHDAASYRELRLEGLKSHPEAFGSSWQDETSKSASWWAERLQATMVFGGWIAHSPLLGVAGLHRREGAKHRHKAVLWGMYIRPTARGSGLAAALVQEVIAHARPLVEEINLTVVASNVAARRLYSAAGFKEYGLERRALKLGDEYYDEMLMALPLREPEGPFL